MAERTTYTGTCVGGPMDGQSGESRYPEGFVLHDSDTDRFVGTYLYVDTPDGGQFDWREPERELLDYEKAIRTANGSRFDVRAYDPEVMS